MSFNEDQELLQLLFNNNLVTKSEIAEVTNSSSATLTSYIQTPEEEFTDTQKNNIHQLVNKVKTTYKDYPLNQKEFELFSQAVSEFIDDKSSYALGKELNLSRETAQRLKNLDFTPMITSLMMKVLKEQGYNYKLIESKQLKKVSDISIEEIFEGFGDENQKYKSLKDISDEVVIDDKDQKYKSLEEIWNDILLIAENEETVASMIYRYSSEDSSRNEEEFWKIYRIVKDKEFSKINKDTLKKIMVKLDLDVPSDASLNMFYTIAKVKEVSRKEAKEVQDSVKNANEKAKDFGEKIADNIHEFKNDPKTKQDNLKSILKKQTSNTLSIISKLTGNLADKLSK